MMQSKLLRGYLERNGVKASCSDGEMLPHQVEEKNSGSVLETSILTLL